MKQRWALAIDYCNRHYSNTRGKFVAFERNPLGLCLLVKRLGRRRIIPIEVQIVTIYLPNDQRYPPLKQQFGPYYLPTNVRYS
jgi:hypothetical protein